MTRAAAVTPALYESLTVGTYVARVIGLAREHLADYVPTADVVLATSREPKTALGGGVRLVVTLTVVVDDPDAPVDESPTWPSGDFAIGDDRSQP